jgi:hypothetical protein
VETVSRVVLIQPQACIWAAWPGRFVPSGKCPIGQPVTNVEARPDPESAARPTQGTSRPESIVMIPPFLLRTAIVALTLVFVSAGEVRRSATAACADQGVASTLSLAREAIGGSRLSTVTSLLMVVEAQDIVNRGAGPTVTSNLELRFVLPDVFLQSRRLTTMPQMVQWFGFRGDELLERTDTPPGIKTFPNPNRELRQVLDASRVQRLRRDVTRLLVGLLLADRTPLAITYSLGGRAASPDGTTADVLRVSAPDGFDLKVFVDTKTRLPLMMTFDEGEIPQGILPSDPALSDVKKHPMLHPEIVPQALYFGDRREMRGLRLPSSILATMAGQTVRQWQVKDVRVNPKGLLDEFPRQKTGASRNPGAAR